MRRPQASAAGDEPWTMEGFQALQALDRSRRRVRFAIVGSPAVACVWAFTIDLSRQFEAGRRAPPPGARLFDFVWFHFSLGVEELVGRTGIHVAFASLLAMAVGVGLWGSMQRRDLDRRGVTARALRHEQGTRLRWLRAGEQGAEPEAPGAIRPRASRHSPRCCSSGCWEEGSCHSSPWPRRRTSCGWHSRADGGAPYQGLRRRCSGPLR